MTNVKVTKWKHCTNNHKMAPTVVTILGRNSVKYKRKRKQKKTTKGRDMNLKYSLESERKKNPFKSKKKLLLFWRI